MTTKTLDTLADCAVHSPRCSGCSEDIPLSALVTVFLTPASTWVVVECYKCKRSTPFQLEAE
jgi:hypothetical protein